MDHNPLITIHELDLLKPRVNRNVVREISKELQS